MIGDLPKWTQGGCTGSQVARRIARTQCVMPLGGTKVKPSWIFRIRRVDCGDFRGSRRSLGQTRPQAVAHPQPQSVAPPARRGSRSDTRRAVPPKIVPSPRRFTEDPLCDVRNPRNGAAILAVPRLNLLCSATAQNLPGLLGVKRVVVPAQVALSQVHEYN